MNLGEFRLRPHQLQAIHQARQEIAALIKTGRPPRVLIVSPCGSGKTVLSSGIIKGAYDRSKRTLFIARGRQLIFQKSRTLERAGVPHAILMDGEEDRWYRSLVTVASKDTYWSRAFADDKLGRLDVDLVIIDEAHAMGSNQVLSMIPDGAAVIGLTATPVYPNGRGMGSYWSSIVVAATYSELIASGMIVPARVYAPWSVDTRGLKKTDGDWSWDQVAKRAKKLTGNVVDSWLKHGEGRPTVCFAQNVEHSVALCREFNNRMIPSAHIDADTPQEERDEAFEALRDGRLSVLCNFGVLTVGFDLPALACGILAFSTASLVKYLQVVGRVLRAYPGKQDALVIDHGDNVRRHGWPTEDHEWSLEGDSDTTDKEAAEKKQREQKLREPICCYQCGAMRQSGPVCPNCGEKKVRRGVMIRNESGELREIRPRDLAKTIATDQHVKLWRMCLGVAAHRGMTYNQARAMFHKKTGQWPSTSLGYCVQARHELTVRVSKLFPNFCRRRSDAQDRD